MEALSATVQAIGRKLAAREIGDSVMTHRRRYNVAAGSNSYIDLLVLDPLNPRSVLFQVAELREQIEKLPGGIEDGQLSTAAKAVL